MANRSWTPNTWWQAPASERRWAYYLCLRQMYGMPATEAWSYIKDKFPGGVPDLVGDIRAAIKKGKEERA